MNNMNVLEHEAKLKLINSKYMNGELSRSEVQTEIEKLLGVTPEEKEKELLDAQINERISWKMREKLSAEQYFAIRAKILQKILGCAEEDAEKAKMEEARVTGEFCPHCKSTEVVSYDSQKWLCKKCKRFFRKH